MKKTFITIICAAALIAVGCERTNVLYDVDYTVLPSAENTYIAGQPVTFELDGDVDNILFYSGETGHCYEYSDRYAVPVEDVNSAKLTIRYQARYGYEKGLSVFVTNSFQGLSGVNAEEDRKTCQALEAKYDATTDELEGWTRLDYNEGASSKWTEQEYDLTNYMDNFCIAFYWHPIYDGKSAQRTYWINPTFTLDLKGLEPSVMTLKDFGGVNCLSDSQATNPYLDSGNGSVRFLKINEAELCFQGVSATALNYGLHGWFISNPRSLNAVSNDKGVVIKNMQNYLNKYTYTWDTPGTYKVVFVGTNANYLGSHRDVKEFTITILPDPSDINL